MMTYNGFPDKQRRKKWRIMHKLLKEGLLSPPVPPCQMCGDPDSEVIYHSEDYSDPYDFSSPSTYKLCRVCHSRIHRRLKYPESWLAYKAHLKRGGYGSDLNAIPVLRRELAQLASSFKTGEILELATIRDKTLPKEEIW